MKGFEIAQRESGLVLTVLHPKQASQVGYRDIFGNIHIFLDLSLCYDFLWLLAYFHRGVMSKETSCSSCVSMFPPVMTTLEVPKTFPSVALSSPSKSGALLRERVSRWNGQST